MGQSTPVIKEISALSLLPERFSPLGPYTFGTQLRVFPEYSPLPVSVFQIQEVSSNAHTEYHTEKHLSMSGGHCFYNFSFC